MSRMIGVASLMCITRAAFGCGGGSSAQPNQNQGPSPQQPSPPPAPTITAISPTSATVGSADLTLAITGSNFVHDVQNYHSQVAWTVNGKDSFLATTFLSSTQLTAVIPAALMSSVVAAKVTVGT